MHPVNIWDIPSVSPLSSLMLAYLMAMSTSSPRKVNAGLISLPCPTPQKFVCVQFFLINTIKKIANEKLNIKEFNQNIYYFLHCYKK